MRLAIEAGTLPALLEQWDREAAALLESRKPYLLYPEARRGNQYAPRALLARRSQACYFAGVMRRFA